MFNIPLSKLYTNSIMSSFNARAGWKYGSAADKALSGQSLSYHGQIDTVANNNQVAVLGNSPTVISGHMKVGSRIAIGCEILRSYVQPVQHTQVFIDVESHEMQDFDQKAGHHMAV